MTKTNQNLRPEVTVFYDGSCPLCTAEIGIYKQADSNDLLNLVDVSLHTFSGDAQITQQAAMARFHVRLADGKQVSGARGFVEVWRVIPSWSWLARFAEISGAVPILEMLYRLFLRARPLMVSFFKSTNGSPHQHIEATENHSVRHSNKGQLL